MDRPIEVAFTSDSSNLHNNCCVWNLETGSLLSSFKGENSESRTLSLIDDDYLVGAVIGKPLLKLWTIGKIQREESTFIMPGVVSSLAVTPCGNYCVGAIDSNLHLWQVTTGELLAVLSNHYQAVTCVKFSDDGSHFVSGAKDSVVIVWLLSQVLNPGEYYGNIEPRHTWTNHSAEVTDIFIGGLGIFARVATVSKDGTCKIYEMLSGQRVLSIFIDAGLSSVTMDPAEYFVMIGTETGDINKIDIFSSNQSEIHHNELKEKAVFVGHSDKVTCLSVSMDGSILLSGSEDMTCMLWDMRNISCLMTLPHSAPITNAFITMSPFALLSSHKVEPKFPVTSFKRHLASDGDDIKNSQKTVPVRLYNHTLSSFQVDANVDDFNKAICHGMKEHGAVSRDALQKRILECETINHQMYSYALNSFMSSLEKPQ